MTALLAIAAVFGSTAPQDRPVKLDPEFRTYLRGEPVSGTLQSIGSDTLNVVMNHWSTGLSKHHAGLRVLVEGKGSNTAPLALSTGASQLGPMSREMKQKEIDVFVEKQGHAPTRLRVALDALAVFVHKTNPLEEITLDELDAVYSRERKRGAKVDVAAWSQLGVKGELADRKIRLVSRNTLSGTYSFFREHVLKEGAFKDTIVEQPGSAAVVDEVARDPNAIGYSGAGYVTGSVKKLRIAVRKGEPAVPPDAEHVYDGSYPLYRFLYLYVNRVPGRPIDPAVKEFCRYALSREGQGDVAKDGYTPLPAATAQEELKQLE